MLIQFAVENFLSFGEKTVFSMRAADHVKTHPDHVCEVGGERVLRSALIYGANASGKSNFIRALQFAQTLIEKGTAPGKQIPILPFRLKAKPDAVSTFEFEIGHEDDRYSYGFRVSAESVVQEWLFRTRRGKEVLLFERDDTENKTSQINIKFGRGFKEDRQRLQFLAEGTRREQLFVTEAYARKIFSINPLMNFFNRKILPILTNFVHPGLGNHLEGSRPFRDFLEDSLKRIQTGITSIHTKRMAIEEAGIPSASFKEILSQPGVARALNLEPVTGSSEQIIRVKTHRQLTDGTVIEFDLGDESDGTRRFIDLAAILNFAPEIEFTAVIDELDRSLHALLTRFYLQKFLEGHSHTQIICTTHDTTLLDLDLVRPDEIWFAEKDPEHRSHLHSLAEFKEEQLAKLGKDLEKGYLQGRFGAIPFFGNPGKLGLSKDSK